MDLSTRLRDVATIAPESPALQFEGTWRPWRMFTQASSSLDSQLDELGLGPAAKVGVIIRNQPEIAATVIALLTTRRCLVTVPGETPPTERAAELRRLRLPVVVASAVDIDPELIAACEQTDTVLLSVADKSDLGIQRLVGEPGLAGADSFAPSVAVQMLTSGSTGPPKRVDLLYRSLELEAEASARTSRSGRQSDAPRLSGGVSILWSSLLHIAGIRGLLESVVAGRRTALMRRFDVFQWADLVSEYRPKTVLLVPATLRMIFDADVDPKVFDGVVAVVTGSAPLEPEFAAEFSGRYGVPVLPVYGATEFAGSVAGWTLADWHRFQEDKAGSVGRAAAGIELRVVDAVTGAVLDAGVDGTLELRGAQLATDSWVRTSDLARIDGDGFLYILGRTDDVIIRGGLKVSVGSVASTLRGHPAVRDAIVLGVPDRRLGEVPVAAVECIPASEVTESELLEFLRTMLPPYQVPTRVVMVSRLPRTPSLKVSHSQVREIFENGEVGAGAQPIS